MTIIETATTSPFVLVDTDPKPGTVFANRTAVAGQPHIVGFAKTEEAAKARATKKATIVVLPVIDGKVSVEMPELPGTVETDPQPVKAVKKSAGTKADLITATNLVGFPIGGATPDHLRERVGSAVEGHDGYYVRYPYATYNLARKVGEVEGPDWLAVCQHGNVSAGAAQLMGPEGVEKQAAARKTWCAECATPAPKPAPATKKAEPAKKLETFEDKVTPITGRRSKKAAAK